MVRKCINGIFFLLTLLGMLSILLILVPYLFKIKPQIVLSGSMEPEISVGSLVYISENIPPEEIQEQDVIAYRRGEQMQVLHRVIQVDEKKKMFQTKGDANENADPGMVDFSQYVGKEVFSIPYLGYGADFIQTGGNRFWLGGGIVILLAMDFLWHRKERRANSEENG